MNPDVYFNYLGVEFRLHDYSCTDNNIWDGEFYCHDRGKDQWYSVPDDLIELINGLSNEDFIKTAAEFAQLKIKQEKADEQGYFEDLDKEGNFS